MTITVTTNTSRNRALLAVAALALPTLLVAIDISVLPSRSPRWAGRCTPAPPSCCG